MKSLYIYPNVVDAIEGFVKKRWPKKLVKSQNNPNAWQQYRYIQISAECDIKTLHYEYANGYLELHLENPNSELLYQHLREALQPSEGKYVWITHKQPQDCLRYNEEIVNILELADALVKFIELVDPVVIEFNQKNSVAIEDTIEELEPASNAETVSNERQDVVLNTLTLNDVFSKCLKIPSYQRIYCWPQKNVELLLDDLYERFSQNDYKYHLGTIILQNKGEENEIIDGQQRLVTLSLLLKGLGKNDISLLNEKFESAEANRYIAYNKYLIETFVKKHITERAKIQTWKDRILNNVSLDVLTLQDTSLDLAYTFFSTQNSRGKALTDYELLKSHHLRYIPGNYESQQRHLAGMWDELLVRSERDNGDQSVSITLGSYLYNLRKWTRNQTWYYKEVNRVKHEFEAAPIISEIPPFGEQFEFMDPIQGGTHFFAYVEKFIQSYKQFQGTQQYNILWRTITCSGILETTNKETGNIQRLESRSKTHWWYGDSIASLLFAYYLKFGNQYLAEALTCITRIVSQIRYATSKANRQTILDKTGELGIIQMINQATSPTFFLAEARDVIKRLPYFDKGNTGIRTDYFRKEMALYAENCKYYLVKFDNLHNHD